MKIATWNVNGVRARINTLIAWLEKTAPDIVCLQETKTINEEFPYNAIEPLGYYIARHGQKGLNGVAILSKFPFDEININFSQTINASARLIEAVILTKQGPLRIFSLYAPNGNPVFINNLYSEKFLYKREWIQSFIELMQERILQEEAMIIAGDFNIIPEKRDLKNIEQWQDNALFQLESQKSFHQLNNLGLFDSLRCMTQSSNAYTFWAYQAGAWRKNDGIRIDHILLTAEAANHLQSGCIEKTLRSTEKPSDHVPVNIHLSLHPM